MDNLDQFKPTKSGTNYIFSNSGYVLVFDSTCADVRGLFYQYLDYAEFICFRLSGLSVGADSVTKDGEPAELDPNHEVINEWPTMNYGMGPGGAGWPTHPSYRDNYQVIKDLMGVDLMQETPPPGTSVTIQVAWKSPVNDREMTDEFNINVRGIPQSVDS